MWQKKPNCRNFAKVQKLMVQSCARRNNVGLALTKTLDLSTLHQHRGLLFLEIQAESAAEALCRYLEELLDYAPAPDS